VKGNDAGSYTELKSFINKTFAPLFWNNYATMIF